MIGIKVRLTYWSGVAALPAHILLKHLDNDNPNNESKEYLKDFGEAMMDILPFGMVVGEFWVKPHLIYREDYYRLRCGKV